jgi:hypothetical protein
MSATTDKPETMAKGDGCYGNRGDDEEEIGSLGDIW